MEQLINKLNIGGEKGRDGLGGLEFSNENEHNKIDHVYYDQSIDLKSSYLAQILSSLQSKQCI